MIDLIIPNPSINNYVSEENNNEDEELEDIEKVLKKLSEKNNDRKEPKKNLHVQNLASHIEEYMNSFIIMGYDINDEPVMIRVAPTHKDLDSLNHSVMRYVSMHKMGNIGSDIGDFGEDFD